MSREKALSPWRSSGNARAAAYAWFLHPKRKVAYAHACIRGFSAVLSWPMQVRQRSPCIICSYPVAPCVEGSTHLRISDKKGSTPTNLLCNHCNQRVKRCLGNSCFERATARHLGRFFFFENLVLAILVFLKCVAL